MLARYRGFWASAQHLCIGVFLGQGLRETLGVHMMIIFSDFFAPHSQFTVAFHFEYLNNPVPAPQASS